MEQYFDINRIVKITLYDRRETSYKWLPKKQKTWFFGLFKLNKWHSSGFYSNGCYKECYESGCWDATPSTSVDLLNSGYIIENKIVYSKPCVSIQLTDKCEVTKKFTNYKDAKSWVTALITKSQNLFEVTDVSNKSTSFNVLK